MSMESSIIYSGFSAEKNKLESNLSETLLKMEAFKDLKDGWHFGEGHGPTNELIQKAIIIAKSLQMEFFCLVDTFPGTGGEIQVTAYPGQYFIEVNILNDGNMELYVELIDQEEIIDLEKLSMVELMHHLKIFKHAKLWKSFAFYPPSTLTKNYPDFQASPSGILLVQEEASPYLTRNVPFKSQNPPVDTSTATTEPSASSHLYIGDSVQVNYQQVQN